MRRKKVISLVLALIMLTALFTGLSAGSNLALAEDGLVMHLKFDGNLEDSSGNDNNAECTYGKAAYEDGIFGKAVKLNGKSYLEVADSDTLDIEKFTISLWAYKVGHMRESDKVPYVYKGEDEECWTSPYKLYEFGDNTPIIDLHDTSDGTYMDQFYMRGNPIDIRKWFLLTVTYNGKEVRMYENDTLMKKQSVTGSPTPTIGSLYIGMSDGEYFFNGYMDDLRIYNRALSAGEVTALYEAGLEAKPEFLTQTNALVAHYKFNGNFKDATDFGNDSEVAAGKISFIDGLNSKAAKFSKNSYLEIQDSTNLDFDQGFTLTAWVNIAEKDKFFTLINKTGPSTQGNPDESAYQILLQHNLYDFYYVPFEYQTGLLGLRYSFDNDTINKWDHIAVTYDTKEVRWYKNGKQIKKEKVPEYSECFMAHSDGSLTIGSNGEYYFNGSMDELKLYNYALTAKEIEKDYKNIDSLSISADNQKAITQVKVGKTVTLKVSRSYIDMGKTEALSSGVTYSSSNKKIFTVTSKGVIKGVKKGSANLTIKHGGISKTYKVTVK